MFERFADKTRRVVVLAQEQARDLGHSQIGAEHIMLGIVKDDDNGAATVLKVAGVTYDKLLTAVAKVSAPNKATEAGHIPFSSGSKDALTRALGEADRTSHTYILSEHILLALISSESDGMAAKVLAAMGVSPSMVKRGIETRLAESSTPGTTATITAPQTTPAGSEPIVEQGSKVLDQFGRNMTAAAREGTLDPVVGRDMETARVMRVLARRTKNNPVLVGEPGVGKSAIVEGLAQRIVAGKVPPTLKGKCIYSLDMGSMVAGTKYRGEFEERMKKILKEVTERTDIILFIDEIHTLVGAGGAEGAIDASSMLKPLLARGQVQTIGATTFDEYRKYIEKDAALERRFQPVKVDEPSVSATIAILRGLRPDYEKHHDVTYTDDAVRAAATLADRYITDRFLPDKAIDLLDEAGAYLRIQRMMEPSDEPPIVDEEVIGEVLSTSTGIPVVRLSTDESSRLLHMEDELHKRVVGQDVAIKALSRSIRRTRAGLKDPKRPGGSFIFAGPTGVGKTELAKALAEFMFDDEGSLITLDMSEFSEKHTAARLFGSPPGYVGYEEGGQLTEKIRRKPFSVVLFDEVEKAHPDIFNALLQVLEEGHLTDAQGRLVDFKNTVIIMTTNLGSKDVAKGVSIGFSDCNDQKGSFERMQNKVSEELKNHFRPEFLNRVDETIVFPQLTRDEIVEIGELEVAKLSKRLAGQGMSLQLTTEAKNLLADLGYDPVLGARPLKRAIQRQIEDELSERILFGSVQPGDTVIVGVADGQFTFESRSELGALREFAAVV